MKKIMLFFIMFHDFRFGPSIFTTHLTYICLKCPFYIITITGKFGYVIFYVEKTLKAYVCQMCGIYVKTKSEISKHNKKKLLILF